MHRDELIKIVKNDENENDVPIVKFTATNDDKTNQIEIKPLNYYEKKQLMPAIGKRIKLLEKYATDVCGNLYKVNNRS